MHPAHVIVATIGSAGDLFPFLRIATDLAARGHRVTVVAPALFAEQVQGSGLAFHGLPADPGVLADPELWHPHKGFGVVWRATRPAMRELRRFVAALPAGQVDAIVAHPLALHDAALCRVSHPHVKIVAAYLAPSNLRTVHGPLALGQWEIPAWLPGFARQGIWRAAEALVLHPVALQEINRERTGLQLAPVASMLDYLHGIADLSVGLFPAWLAPAQPDWPQPFCLGDFPLHDAAPDRAPVVLPAGLQEFLDAGAAPLVFTHGTGNRQAQAFFAAALEASRLLGRRAILLTPERSQLPAELPATVWWQDYVPLRDLLTNLYNSNVAVLVHHGGIGTTAEALRAGVPQLVVPMAFDQFDNAARVRRLGAGHTLPVRRISAKSLSNQLARLLADPTIRPGCEAARRHFLAPTQLEHMLTSIHLLISKTGKN